MRSSLSILSALTAVFFLGGCAEGKDPPAETRKIYIPGGDFMMGTDQLDPCGASSVRSGSANTSCEPKDQAAAIPNSVGVKKFCIDATEVTNLQYRHCVDNEVCKKPESTNLADPNDQRSSVKKYYNDPDTYGAFPVVGVAWKNAQTYCEFHGGSLPTEAQWEFVASSRGTRKGHLTLWSNQNAAEEIADLGRKCPEREFVSLAGCNDAKLRAVGTSQADTTLEKVLDMGGSVHEWVLDEFDFLAYCDQTDITAAFTISDTRPFFTDNTPPAGLITDAACFEDAGPSSSFYPDTGCDKALKTCQSNCTAFEGRAPATPAQKAAWTCNECADRLGEGNCTPNADGTCDVPNIEVPTDSVQCLQDCFGHYRTCADACTDSGVASVCMKLGDSIQKPVPTCLARTGFTGETPHTRPEGFNVGRLANTHSVRGGAFTEDALCSARPTRRNYEAVSSPLVGFRCVFPAAGEACQ